MSAIVSKGRASIGGIGARRPSRTASVPATNPVRADALGRWAYHCHLLYHMEAGMFREVQVRE